MSNVDWLATRNEIISDALTNIGVVPLGEDPSPEQFAKALFRLNSLTKFLETKHLYLWNYSEETVTLVNGQTTYTFTNNDAIGIDQAYYLNAAQQTVPLGVIDQASWFGLGDKLTASGVPDKCYFERGTTTPTISFYVKPNLSTSGCPATIQVRVARRLKDWDLAAGNDWPAWWVEPIIWKLSADLSHVFRSDLNERDRLELKANNLMAEAFADNFRTHDRGDMAFTPD